jgi:hypothetical protein
LMSLRRTLDLKSTKSLDMYPRAGIIDPLRSY